MTLLVQLLVTGIATGAIYSLIALGYTMVYGIIELINFAHGDIFMIGTLVSLTVVNIFAITDSSKPSGWALMGIVLVAFLSSILVCAVLGVVIERVAYRPLRNAPRLAPLISAIGVSLILEDIGKFTLGLTPVPFPAIIPKIPYYLGPVIIENTDILVIVVSVVLMAGLQLLISHTRIGRGMRAVAQDREAAALMGVNVDRVIAITFFIGAGLAGAAGFIYSLQISVTEFNIGFQLGLIAFTAAVLGGIGNIVGAMLGGLLIGLIQALVIFIPDRDLPYGLPHGGLAWSQAVVFAILILILVFRPSGLLGQQVPEKV
ncbi:MAG: branched-chain amino acid ABC transporter permease [Chloroflexi bacterium]|nr:branched-chain amino acid ABC transporter permease [Ktedonobacteraceae bacterium]MBV9020513.1 branched-chain amino acid ABC transporter permease [Ktedonobacteraceae bacterium]MBV9708036.1 branched-chain amino acid ABC transporter permease [Chloroflexota bacterium]